VPSGLYARLCHTFLVSSFFLFFLLGAKLSQYLLDRFSRSFHQMEGICVNFLDQVQFFRFLKGSCHGNQFCFVPDLLARSRSISGSPGPIFTIFAQWQMINPTFFFRYLKGSCHGNQFSGKNRQNYLPLHLSLCHSEMEWDIALQICALIAPLIALHRMKKW